MITKPKKRTLAIAAAFLIGATAGGLTGCLSRSAAPRATITVGDATMTVDAMCRGRIVRDNGDVAAVLECGPAPEPKGGSLVENSLRSVSNEHGANDGR